MNFMGRVWLVYTWIFFYLIGFYAILTSISLWRRQHYNGRKHTEPGEIHIGGLLVDHPTYDLERKPVWAGLEHTALTVSRSFRVIGLCRHTYTIVSKLPYISWTQIQTNVQSYLTVCVGDPNLQMPIHCTYRSHMDMS